MNIETIQKVVKDNEAEIHAGDGVEGKSSNMIIRKWLDVRPEVIEDAVDYLRRYTSAKNGSTESMSVEFLSVDKTVLDGLWRGGKVSVKRDDEGRYTIFQELHQGFVQTVNRNYIYQVTHGDELPDLTDLRFYDAGFDYNGNDVYYGENGVYARWTDATLGDIITLITDIGAGDNIANYFSISGGTLTGNGDWSGNATIGSIDEEETNLSEFIVEDGHLWESGSKETVLKLPNVDPAKEEDIREELKANTDYTNRAIKYETISGTNYYIDSRPLPEDDGSLSILLYLQNAQGTEAHVRALSGDRISTTTVVLNDKTEKELNEFMESVVFADGRYLVI